MITDKELEAYRKKRVEEIAQRMKEHDELKAAGLIGHVGGTTLEDNDWLCIQDDDRPEGLQAGPAQPGENVEPGTS